MKTMRDSIYWTIERGECDIDVIVLYQYCAGRPAKLYGLPENCYPAEPDDVHIESVWLCDAKNIKINLTDDEYEEIADWILDNPPDPDYPY
jgi:hypothetical protein